MSAGFEVHETLDGLRVRGLRVLQRRWARGALAAVGALVLLSAVGAWYAALTAPKEVQRVQCEPVPLDWWGAESLHPDCADVFPERAKALMLDVAAARRRAFWMEQLAPIYLDNVPLPEATWTEIDPHRGYDGLPRYMTEKVRMLTRKEQLTLLRFLDAPPPKRPPATPYRLHERDLTGNADVLWGHFDDVIVHNDGTRTQVAKDHPLVRDAERRTLRDLLELAEVVREVGPALKRDHADSIEAWESSLRQARWERGRQHQRVWWVVLALGGLAALAASVLGWMLLSSRRVDLTLDRRGITVGKAQVRWTDLYGVRREEEQVVYLSNGGKRIESGRIDDPEVLAQVLETSRQMLRQVQRPDPQQLAPDDREGMEALGALRRQARTSRSGG